jgi:hypothetical protein
VFLAATNVSPRNGKNYSANNWLYDENIKFMCQLQKKTCKDLNPSKYCEHSIERHMCITTLNNVYSK